MRERVAGTRGKVVEVPEMMKVIVNVLLDINAHNLVT